MGVILLLSSLVSIAFSVFVLPSMLRLCGPVHFLRTVRKQSFVVLGLALLMGAVVVTLWALAT